MILPVGHVTTLSRTGPRRKDGRSSWP
jgi:hypothetical protein